MTLWSCQSNNNESAILLRKDSVMAVHDEVMPKMGELRRTRKDLMLQADSIIGSDSLKATALSEAANEIATANENMMIWMRNYQDDYEGTDEEVLAYLKEQMVAIQKVKDDMEASLAKGKQALVE